MLATHPELYFDVLEYLLGDSAYSTCFPFVISPYKKPASDIPRNRTFNYFLASARIAIEHCIGILKARFPILLCLRGLIQTDDDIVRMCNLLVVCFILHNMCIETNDLSFDLQAPMGNEACDEDVDCDVDGTQNSSTEFELVDSDDLRICVQQQVLYERGYQE